MDSFSCSYSTRLQDLEKVLSNQLTDLADKEDRLQNILRDITKNLDYSPNPNLGLIQLIRLLENDGAFAIELFECDPRKIIQLLSYSNTIGDLVLANPHVTSIDLAKLDRLLYLGDIEGCSYEDVIIRLRKSYWQTLLAVISLDLASTNSIDEYETITGYLTGLVEETVNLAFDLCLKYNPDFRNIELSVLALGKTGAREMNYVSDVDLIFLLQQNDSKSQEIANLLARQIYHVISSPSLNSPLFQIDTTLRPEGTSGSLVRSLDSALEYYNKWAKSWEFQALLKARPIAGNLELGQSFLTQVSPLVWTVSKRSDFLPSLRKMRQRIENKVPYHNRSRELKLSPGGLRDVEFSIQLLQLVYGEKQPLIRNPNTLGALSALCDFGHIGRKDSAELSKYYRFLRTVEHRCQLLQLKRTHSLPSSKSQTKSIYRSLDPEYYQSEEQFRKDILRTKENVRKIQEDVYYRPIIEASIQAADLSNVVDNVEDAKSKLELIGYLDSTSALRSINTLTSSSNRTSLIHANLLPVILQWMSKGPNPDLGLKSFTYLSEQIGRQRWYLTLLRDSKHAARKLCQILTCSQWIFHALSTYPLAISWLDNERSLTPITVKKILRTISHLLEEENLEKGKLDHNDLEKNNLNKNNLNNEIDELFSVEEKAKAKDQFYYLHPDLLALVSKSQNIIDSEAFETIRLAIKNTLEKEILKLALLDLTSNVYPTRPFLSEICDLIVNLSLELSILNYQQQYGYPTAEICLISMGSYAAKELTYFSDLDLVVVYEPINQSISSKSLECAQKIISIWQKFLSKFFQLFSDTFFRLDFSLRPEGKMGSLIRSFASYREYYTRWAQTWERQALLKSRVITKNLFSQSVSEYLVELNSTWNISPPQIREILLMKARIEKERIPYGTSTTQHLKLGNGGITDIEWTLQLLQLIHKQEINQKIPNSSISTLETLTDLEQLGIMTPNDAVNLKASWNLASRIRTSNFLYYGLGNKTKLDLLPKINLDGQAISAQLGYEEVAYLTEEWLHTSRKARATMDKYFWNQANL